MNTVHRNLTTLTLLGSLCIAVPAHAELDNETWIVRSGDGLYSIARQLAPKDLKMQARIRNEINQLNPKIDTSRLEIGLSLTLPDFLFKPAEPAPVVEPAKLPQPPSPVQISQQTITPDPQEIIGRVVIQTGTMVAENRGSTRPLNRAANILQGDTLKTASDGRSQIRLKDGALLAISPGTELKFEEFAYNGSEDGNERSIINLIKGGFRTITGAIGHVNKQNYQVKTSVATIGIRGTHYGLMLCEAGSCQNNADGSNLRDGLYGGVVDGSIVTSNASGSTTFNNDQYFQIASVTTPAVETLLPPPVFNDAPIPGNKQQHDMAGAPAAGPNGKPPASTLPGTINNGPGGTPPGGFIFNRNPLIAATFNNVFLPPKDIQPGQTNPPPPPGAEQYLPQPAANGSGIAISLSQLGTNGLDGVAAPIIVRDGSKNGIFLEQYTDSTGKVIKNLPFAIHEEHTDLDTGLYQTHDAVRLRPAGNGGASYAELQFGGNALGVNWGVWQGNYALLESIDGSLPAAVAHTPYAHFIYSNNLTPLTTLANLGGLRTTIELYEVIGGTLPTDTLGNVSVSLPNIIAVFDFSNMRLVDYQILVNIADVNWSGRNSNLIRFSQLGNSFNLVGNSACEGCSGEASLIFVGGQAGGVMTSYSIQNLTTGMNGVALLTPAGGAINTPVTALFAMGDTGNPTTTFTVAVGAGSPDSLYVDSTTKAPTAAFHLAGAGGTQYQMMVASANPSVAATAATLFTGGIATGTVYWGRWNAYEASVIDSSSTTSTTLQNEPLHFIHTSNILTPTQLGGLTATAINYFTPIGGDHSFHDGFSAIASPSTAFTIQANFGAQSFTYGVTSTSGATTLSGTGMSGANLNIPFDQMNGFTLAANTTCLTCTGNASLQFVGSVVHTNITNPALDTTYASHAITGYTLTDGFNHAGGVALLGATQPP